MKDVTKKDALNKKIKGISELVTIFGFFAVLLFFMIATIVSPKEEFSEIENKLLSKFPKLSLETWFSGEFPENIEKYVTDHFSGRLSFIKLKSETEKLVGKIEQKDVYILKNRLVEKVSEPNYEDIDRNISKINAFAEKCDVPVYTMIVPTSAEFYMENLPDYFPNLDQKKFIEYCYSNFGDKVVPMNVYSVLSENSNDYIYYRTDHHWTSRGAYLAYKYAAPILNFVPINENNYDIENVGFDFRGSLYSKVLNNKISPDFLSIYHPNNTKSEITMEVISDFGAEPVVYDSVYMEEYVDVKDKYSMYTGPNQPIINIKNSNGSGKILIIKDSYAHSFVPFLAEHYEEITMVDLRYIRINLSSLVDISEYNQIMLLYNASTFSSDRNLMNLNY